MPEKSNKVAVWFLLIAFCLASSTSLAAEPLPPEGGESVLPVAAEEKLVSPAPPAQAKAQTDDDQTEPAPKTPWKRWFVLIIAILLLTGMSAYMRRKR